MIGLALISHAACGTEDLPGAEDHGSPEAVGGCRDDFEYQLVSFVDQIEGIPAVWVTITQVPETTEEIGDGVVLADVRIQDTLGLHNLEKNPLSNPEIVTAAVRSDVLEAIDAETSLGADVALSIQSSVGPGKAEWYVGNAVSMRTRDEAVFLTECGYETGTEPIAQFAASRDLTPVDVVRALIADPHGEIAEAMRAPAQPDAPVAWEDLPPGERAIDLAPPEVVSSGRSIEIVADLPEDWVDNGLMLCSRTTVAWNTCMEVISDRGRTNGEPLSTATHLQFGAWVTEVSDLTLFLVAGDGYTSPITDIASFAPGEIDTELVVTLSGTPDEPIASRNH